MRGARLPGHSPFAFVEAEGGEPPAVTQETNELKLSCRSPCASLVQATGS